MKALSIVTTILVSAMTSIAQTVPLTIMAATGHVAIAWPPGLSFVQPQKCTNLSVGAWEDYGVATTASNLVDAAVLDQGYYRLRLLGPGIMKQPHSQAVVVGGDAVFTVEAAGTAPMAYQWKKNSADLPGKTGPTLAIANLVSGDAGIFQVVVSNQTGAVTSAPAVLTVANPSEILSGIYMGEFSGPEDAGGFGVLLDTNRLAYVVGYNTAQFEGVSKEGFLVATNGFFFTKTEQGGIVVGLFTPTSVSGNFINNYGAEGSFSGLRKSDAGIHADDAGYYTGRYAGPLGFFGGTARVVLAADGTLFFYSFDPYDGDGGGYGTLNALNEVSGTTVPDGYTLIGQFAGGAWGTPIYLTNLTFSISGDIMSGSDFAGSYTTSRTLTNEPAVVAVASPVVVPSGIYMGEFDGPADAGGFGVLLRTNGLAYVAGYNTAQDEGVSKEGFAVATNCLFLTKTDQGGVFGGLFTSSSIGGGFFNYYGAEGTFAGLRKSDTGIHADDAGYYTGSYVTADHLISGTVRAVLAADGTIFFYSFDISGDGGGYGAVDTFDHLSATTVPDGYTIVGLLDSFKKEISGDIMYGNATAGTYTMSRTLAP